MTRIARAPSAQRLTPKPRSHRRCGWSVALGAALLAGCGAGGGVDTQTAGGPNNPAPTPAPTPAPSPTQDPPAATALWSDPATWSSNSVPTAGENVLIAEGVTILLDVETPPLGSLAVEGEIVGSDQQDIGITAADIEIRDGGLLQIGSSQQPFQHRAALTLTGARGLHVERPDDNALDNDGVARGLRVRDGGALILVGATPDRTRSKLNAHADAGATSFTLADPVNWRAGDQVAISLTDFYGVGETEVLTIAADTVGQATLTTASALQTPRWGQLQYPIDATVNGSSMSLTQGAFTPASAETPTVLDERAEIVNLTRNIVVQGADDADWQGAGFGVHVMVMGQSSTAQLDGVELRRCGQRRAMGRYPFHWHMLSYGGDGSFRGDATNGAHYLTNSSIHDSQNRAVTIHGTCGVTVSATFAVDIQGHAFFFEDGAERRNAVSDCVAMKVRDAGGNGLKEHDDNPAGFWLVNPDNWIDRNSASDCEGFGFWNSFATECFGLSRDVELNPNALGIASFDDNVGHSCGILGMQTAEIVIDEAGNVLDSYYEHDAGDAVLRRNIVWKNRRGGYRNRVRQPTYVAWTCADNSGVDIFGAVREASIIESPLMIGTSQNNATPFEDPLRRAFKSYHFALDMIDVTAVNYPFAAGQLHGGDMFSMANTFVYGGGVLDSSDLYLDPITMQLQRCSGWRLINSHAGFRSPSPYFDDFAVSQSNGDRNWALSGALWDPHGYWGPAGNYLVPDTAFYSYGLTSWQSASPAGENGLTTPHVFFGLGNITPGVDSPAYGGSDSMPMRLERLDESGALVGDHFIGDGNTSSVFDFKHFGVARGGRYRLRLPNASPPGDFFNVTIDNGWRADDWFLLALPWSGSAPVTGRLDSGGGNQPLATRIQQGTARALNSSGTSLSDVIADVTGSTMWQDTANELVWVKHVGGLELNVYNYNGTDDASLMRRYQIRLSRP